MLPTGQNLSVLSARRCEPPLSPGGNLLAEDGASRHASTAWDSEVSPEVDHPVVVASLHVSTARLRGGVVDDPLSQRSPLNLRGVSSNSPLRLKELSGKSRPASVWYSRWIVLRWRWLVTRLEPSTVC